MRPGTGKSAPRCKIQENHNEDVKKGLQLIGNWIINLANSNDDLLKIKTLTYFTTVIEQLFNSTLLFTNENSIYSPALIILTPCEPPSFFIISSLFKLYRIKVQDYYYNFQDFQKIGSQIGLELLKNKKQILQKKQELEEPNSLEEYRSALPLKLYGLLDSIIRILFEKRREYTNKQKKYRYDDNKIQKVVVFICSIIISVGFKSIKIWLTRMISSLCRKPHLLSNLHDFLVSVNAAGITRKHERVLEIKRMELADPKLRIWKKPNIWNIAVIDNIDFKEKAFTYRNIYNATRNSSHATLHLLFQYQLPVELSSIPNDEIQLNEDMKLFGENLISNNVLSIFI